MKRLIALCLALLLLLSALPLAGAAFKDEASIDDGFKKAVAKMSDAKILSGFEDGTFGPSKTLTRAQAAKILCVMLEGAEKADALTKTETGFSDVPATHWAAKYVAYCVDKGIVAGVGDGKFDPDGKLSSGAFAKMLLVAYGKDGSKFTGAEWLKNVQEATTPTFYTYQLDKGLSNDPMQRQEAAQLAFNAMFQAESDADRAKSDPREYKPTVPETMKLFIIGNSYSNDATIAYLYEELKDLGVKDLVIGILYYSGCHYNQHVDFALQDKPVYKYYYYKNSSKMVTKTKTTFDKSIADEDWTHIMTIGTGFAEDFGPCPWQDLVLYYARKSCPNAYYFYEMPWSYRTDGQHSDTHQKRIDRFGGDSLKQYQGIVDVTKQFVGTEPRFKNIVPVGTSVINARSSFIGNGVHRDKISHLNKGVGRYLASMTVCCILTGATPDQIKYVPNLLKKNVPAGLSADTPGLQEALEKVAKEAVTNALAKPFEFTQSAYTTAPK